MPKRECSDPRRRKDSKLVDIVHHSAIGMGGALASQAMGQPEIGMGFLLGSFIPDLDVAATMLGNTTYLKLHQGFTHSIVGISALTLVIGTLLQLATDFPFVLLATGLAAGMVLHVALDLSNTFGVQVFWPLPGRHSIGAAFFIDLPLLLLTTGTIVGLVLRPDLSAFLCISWLTTASAYLAARLFHRLRIKKALGSDTEIPSGIDPRSFFVTRTELDGIRTGIATGWKPAVKWTGLIPTTPREMMEILSTGPIFSSLRESLKHLVPVETRTEGTRTIVVSRCVAVPNFGNRYGETVSTIVDGRVVDEKARI